MQSSPPKAPVNPFAPKEQKPLAKAVRRSAIYSSLVLAFAYASGMLHGVALAATVVCLPIILAGVFYLDEAGKKKQLSQLLAVSSAVWLTVWIWVTSSGRIPVDSPARWSMAVFIALIPALGIWLALSDLSGKSRTRGTANKSGLSK